MNTKTIGTKVKVLDGSYAVRVDQYEEHSHIGLCKDIFEIIQLKNDYLKTKSFGTTVHDIIIQNTVNKQIYLHTSSLVIPIKVKQISRKEAKEMLRENYQQEFEIID